MPSERLLILQDGCSLKGTEQDEIIETFFLPNPRTGEGQVYLLKGGILQELNFSKLMFGSWAFERKLLADGSLYLSTPVDPIFLLLPFLDGSARAFESAAAAEFGSGSTLGHSVDRKRIPDSAASPAAKRLRKTTTETPYAERYAGNDLEDDLSDRGVAPLAEITAGSKSQNRDAEGASLFRAIDELLACDMFPDMTKLVSRLSNPCPPSPTDPHPRAPSPTSAPDSDLNPGSSRTADVAVHHRTDSGRTSSTLSALDSMLRLVCDTKEVPGFGSDSQSIPLRFYRLNERRALAWLLCKLKQVQTALSTASGQPTSVASGIEFIAEYVAAPWIAKLKEAAAATKVAAVAPGGLEAAVDPWLLSSGELAEAFGSGGGGGGKDPVSHVSQKAPVPSPPPPKKATANSAALAKQAVGTKKISSFFSAAAKKKA